MVSKAAALGRAQGTREAEKLAQPSLRGEAEGPGTWAAPLCSFTMEHTGSPPSSITNHYKTALKGHKYQGQGTTRNETGPEPRAELPLPRRPEPREGTPFPTPSRVGRHRIPQLGGAPPRRQEA